MISGEVGAVGSGQGRRRRAAVLLAAFGVLAWAVAARAQGAPPPPTAGDSAMARSTFAEAQAVCARDGGTQWGRSLCGPLLLVQPATHAAMANEADSAGVLRGSGGLFVGILPQNFSVGNTSVQWGGRRWTMLLWPLPDERYERQRLLAHEMFHSIQPALGIPMANPQNAHMDTRDGRIWFRLESRALAEALIREGEARRLALADALGFRARRQALAPGAGAEENALELNEGLAEYTGLLLSGLPRDVLADRAAVQLNRYEHRESLARAFAYATGPALGLLLDAASPNWRKQLKPDANLAQTLAEAYKVQAVAAERIQIRAAAYDGPRIVAQENSRAVEQEATIARMKTRFVNGPVLRLPVAGKFNFSFDPNGVITLPGAGTLYSSAQVGDVWGTLDVSSGGVLFSRAGNLINGVVVPAPAGTTAPPTSGEGWTLHLAPGWRVVPGARQGDWEVKPT